MAFQNKKKELQISSLALLGRPEPVGLVLSSETKENAAIVLGSESERSSGSYGRSKECCLIFPRAFLHSVHAIHLGVAHCLHS